MIYDLLRSNPIPSIVSLNTEHLVNQAIRKIKLTSQLSSCGSPCLFKALMKVGEDAKAKGTQKVGGVGN